MLYNAGFGDGVTELELLPGADVTGENMFAQVELVGYRDPVTRQIKIHVARLTGYRYLKPSIFSFE